MNTESRQKQIETYAVDGNIEAVKALFDLGYIQTEIDSALELAIAYGKIDLTAYLILLGAELSALDYNGIYYAAHNDELESIKFAIQKGIDINIQNGMLLNTSIQRAINTKNIKLVKWLLDNGAMPRLITKQSLWLVDNYATQELKELIKEVSPFNDFPVVNKKKQSEIRSEQFRKTPLIVMLICGIIIMLIGIWLIITNATAIGLTIGNRYGVGAGRKIVLTGTAIIFIGTLVCAFPVLQLTKRK